MIQVASKDGESMSVQNGTDGKISLLDLLLVLLERKWFLIAGMLVVSISAVILTMVLPKSYSAKAVVLPPSSSMSMPLGSLLGGGGGSDAPISGLLKSFNLFGSSAGTEQLRSILDSRRLAEKVIAEFDLETHYKFKERKKYYPEDVIRSFHQALKVVENDWGNLEISVQDKTPERAQGMVNFIVSQLDSINYILAKEHAGFSRRFFEERLAVIRADLDSAHARFARFKIKNNYLDLDKQVESTVDVLANIEAERMAIDLQIDQLRNKMGGDNQRVNELVRERTVLARKMEGYMSKGDGEVLVALRSTPTLGIEYAYLFRDVKVQETLFQFVLQMFEQAKMNEANNVPTVRVLEYASLPKKKVKPKRMIICLLAFFAGFVFLSCWILIGKWLAVQRTAGTDTYRKLALLGSHLRLRR